MTPTTLSLRYAALSDVGLVRKDNQDSGFASDRLLVVADGVGGAARGDVASSTAVQILRRLDAPAPEDVLEAVAGAIHRAHDRIAELVDEDPELEGTSTTVTAALFDGTRIAVGHVGDSRGYLLRDGDLSQLTRDHTFVQSLIDEGRITEEESRNHPQRNLILRAVDGVHETDPDLFLVDLAPGDRLLLCSDGCSGALEPERLAEILGAGTVDFAAVELVRASLDAGSSDNITVVVADVLAAEDGAAGAASDGDAALAGASSTTSGGSSSDDLAESASSSVGPMLVGAAADQPRHAGANAPSSFRGHRGGDTDELEPVPAADDDAEDKGGVDPEVLRYAPRPPARFTWLRRLGILLAAGLVLALIAALGYRWTQNQYYVAAAGDRVAIYQGVQADVPGLTLSSVQESSEVTLAALLDSQADRVRDGIVADDLDDAREIVGNIGSAARACPDPEQSPSPSPDGSPTGGQQDGDQQDGDQQSGGQQDGQQDGGQQDGGQQDGGQQDGGQQDGQPGDQTAQQSQPSPTGAGSPGDSSGDSATGDGQRGDGQQGDGPQGEPSQSPRAEASPTLQPPDCVEVTQ